MEFHEHNNQYDDYNCCENKFSCDGCGCSLPYDQCFEEKCCAPQCQPQCRSKYQQNWYSYQEYYRFYCQYQYQYYYNYYNNCNMNKPCDFMNYNSTKPMCAVEECCKHKNVKSKNCEKPRNVCKKSNGKCHKKSGCSCSTMQHHH